MIETQRQRQGETGREGGRKRGREGGRKRGGLMTAEMQGAECPQ